MRALHVCTDEETSYDCWCRIDADHTELEHQIDMHEEAGQ